MDSIGAEVGQKMRSAIKAKLMELDCYVDDELPDYIMVMVANRRTKSQMNEDLNLFLSSKTSTFVNWLHIVLKKLKEVTVTNPEVYQKALKRKSIANLPDDKSSLKLKKEKTSKKMKKELQSENNSGTRHEGSSLTDDLPVSGNKMSDHRKIIVDSAADHQNDNIVDDNFDIPLLSEVNESVNEQELQDIEKKIRDVKSRLGLIVQSDSEEETSKVKSEDDRTTSDYAANKNEKSGLADARKISFLENEIAESEGRNPLSQNREVVLEKDISSDVETTRPDSEPTEREEKRHQHKRITFENAPEPVPIRSRLNRAARDSSRDRFRDKSRERSPRPNSLVKKRSVLERLGKRLESPQRSRRSDYRHEEDKYSGHRSVDSRNRSTSRERDRKSRILDRLGRDRRKRDSSRDEVRSRSRDRSPLKSRDRNSEKDAKREVLPSRLGVQSKISVIKKRTAKPESDSEEEKVVREVQSAIKVKPRVIPSDIAQPNKNLLLKAVAEAQRSVAQTPTVGKEVKVDGLLTKKRIENLTTSPEQDSASLRRHPDQRRSKFKEIIRISSSRMRSRLHLSSDEYDSEGEYIPKPLKKIERDVPKYVPSSKSGSEPETRENDTKENGKQQFIITLDGIEKFSYLESKLSIKSRLNTTNKKRSPSPIVFDKSRHNTSENKASRPDIPDKLPIVHPPLSVKNKERCRYWPTCRQGDKCEFVHPSENCQMFPKCKFGEKCLFLHPVCKFGSSCTKRDCPYDHKTAISAKIPAVLPAVQNCKFFPNCANTSCPFYHPKPCKYGKYCKNIPDCTFSHAFVVNKKNLSWKSK